MDLEIVILSEVRQKDKYRIPLRRGILKKGTNELYKAETGSQPSKTNL